MSSCMFGWTSLLSHDCKSPVLLGYQKCSITTMLYNLILKVCRVTKSTINESKTLKVIIEVNASINTHETIAKGRVSSPQWSHGLFTSFCVLYTTVYSFHDLFFPPATHYSSDSVCVGLSLLPWCQL